MTLVQTEPKSIKIWNTPIKKVTIRPNGTEKQIRPVLPKYNWNLANATQDQSRQPTSISNNRCIDISSDGLHILLSNEGWPVTEHTLSTAYDLTSTITTKTANLKTKSFTDSVCYNDDGTRIYVNNTNSSSQSWSSVIEQRPLSTPFDISTAWSVTYSKTTDSWYRLWCFRFYDNWTKIIWWTRDGKLVNGSLSTAWRIDTLWSLTAQVTFWDANTINNGCAISPDGKYFRSITEYKKYIYQFNTNTPYTFTSTNTGIVTPRNSTWGFWVDISDDGKYFFVARQNGYIYRYTFATV